VKAVRDFGRVITAMVTPFHQDGSVNYEQTSRLARFLVERGSDGLVVAGTTGESPVLTQEEKLKLFKVVKEAVGDQAAVIAGTGSNNTANSIDMSKAADSVGVDGVLLVVPYYNKPNQEGLYRHFKAVAEAISVPVLLYNIPGRTGINMPPELIAKLAEIDNITAVKEATGSLDQATDIRRRTRDDFRIYSGDDSLTLPILSVGGHGVVSVAAHLAGSMIKEMVDHYTGGRVKEALAIHLKLFPLFKVLFCTSNPIPLKAALNMIGMDVGSPRLPLVEATDKEKEEIRRVMSEFNIKMT
jgi:4-hydroxy-tetrahydrodipicolinate synthase